MAAKNTKTRTTTKDRKDIFGIAQRNGQKGFWTRIGVAFENQDGSWNLRFDYLPTEPGTTIQMRDPKAAEE